MYHNVLAFVSLVIHVSFVASYPKAPAFLAPKLGLEVSNYSIFGILDPRQGCSCTGGSDPGCCSSLGQCCGDVCCINVGSMPNVCITNSDGSPKCCNPLDPSCRSAPTSKSTPPPPITTVTTTTKETSTVKTTESLPPPPAPTPPPITTTHPAPPPPTTTHSSSTPTTTSQPSPSTSAAPSSTLGTTSSTPGITSSTPIATSPTANQIPDFTQSFAPAPSQGSTTTNVTVSANDPNITVAGPFWTNSTSICDNNTPCKKNSVAGQALSYRFVGTAVYMFNSKSTANGQFSVSIDNQSPVAVDSYSNSTNPTCGIDWSAFDLEDKLHILLITTLGQSALAGAGDAASTFELDGFTISRSAADVNGASSTNGAHSQHPMTFRAWYLNILFAITVNLIIRGVFR